MKQLIWGLALWPLFLSLHLLKQVGSSKCSNKNYVINVMLMADLDFPSSVENLTSAVKEALTTVQEELAGKAMGMGNPFPTMISS